MLPHISCYMSVIVFLLRIRRPPIATLTDTLFPYTTLFRSAHAAADRLISTTLELGGKSPMIVMEDADLDRTVAGAVAGMRFTRQGQSCTAASQIGRAHV